MKAEIRGFHSPDVDLEHPDLKAAEDFVVLLQVMVGPVGVPGEESFDVLVCSPSWLARKVEKDGSMFGWNYLVVACWDFNAIQRTLVAAFEHEEAPTWLALAGRLGRLGKWEFEDYQDL